MSTLVETHDHGPLRELRMARAPVNALDPALCSALTSALRAAAADGVCGVVLAGGPKVFSAGLDVPFLLGLGTEDLHAAWAAFFETARTLAAAPMPVVAAIAGHAPAGGCVLALCCDYRVMASGGARIGLNETQVGLVAPEGIQRVLARVVGAHRAERLLVAGELVDAGQALAIGLVDELVDGDAVTARARAWLEGLLALPRRPMLRTRQIARADLVAALAPDRLKLADLLESWSDPDTQAGLRALVARLGK
ncbi:MAG TPA: enoyl-CoA hydratase/isomerase family protein [Luteimonas sp.]|nr:enoyl-CoA hydratase/isomerase family protein [Luteimonas sp.]